MNEVFTVINIIIRNPSQEDLKALAHEYGYYLEHKYNFKFNKSEHIKNNSSSKLISATRSTLKHHGSTSKKRADILEQSRTGTKYIKTMKKSVYIFLGLSLFYSCDPLDGSLNEKNNSSKSLDLLTKLKEMRKLTKDLN